MPIDRPTFVTTRMRTGYDVEQVDLAVAMILENLSLPTPRIGPGDVEGIEFSTVSYQAGYDMDQVDDWLGDVSDELARRTGELEAEDDVVVLEPPTPAPAAYAPVTRSDAIVEVKGSSSRVLLVLGALIVLAVVFYLLYP